MKIIIFQPAIPSYRIPFFDAVSKHLDTHISAALVDQLGVQSVLNGDFSMDIRQHIKNPVKGFHFQINCRIPSKYRRGDIVVINGNPRYLSNYLIWFQAKLRGMRIVWWGHGWTGGSRGIQVRIRQMIMSFFDCILLYTDSEAEEYVKLGFHRNKVFALNNGLDVAAIRAVRDKIDSAALKRFREAHSLSQTKSILFVGRLTEKSSVEVLLHAAALLKDLAVKLVIIGDGPNRETYEALTVELGLASCVTFTGAIFEEEQLAPWFMTAECLVYPGSVGLSLIHAFSYGLPAVVHDSVKDHMPEIAAFTNCYNGLSFKKDDSKSLSLTLRFMLENSSIMPGLRENAAKTVTDTFNINDMCRRFVSMVASL